MCYRLAQSGRRATFGRDFISRVGSQFFHSPLRLSETQSRPEEETEGESKGAHRARRTLRLEPQGRGLRDVRAAARRLRPLLPEICRALRSGLPVEGGRASRSAPRDQRYEGGR